MRKHGVLFNSHRNMVREAFDQLPNGICFFNKNGIPVLCNLQMHRLCFELLGCDLQSQEELAAALKKLPEKSLYLMRDGTAWQFTVETAVDSYGESYTEYIAADVTRLNNLKAELEESNREQQENIRSIANISRNLAMITRNEEILKLKMKIHNELGESLRASHRFLTEGCPMEKKDAFADRHIEMAKVLLGEVESEKEPNPFELLKDIATDMGMNIVITGELPHSEALRTMLSYAVRECLTNTIRHANGDGKRNKKVGYLVEAINRTSEHNYTTTIEKYNTELELKVEEKTEHINHIKDLMVLGMASMVESRDNSTGGHIRRTSDVVRVFAEELKKHSSELDFSEKFLQMVIKAAPMHDLGKIAVDDAILRKNGKFTDEEYEQMKRHSAEGAKIVRNILLGVEEQEFVDIAENIAHYHHEKWNGQGYPCGIEGTAIPIEARIMALADVFDALVSKRCYKEAFTYDKAFSIIEDSLGSHFDPVLGRIFIDCRPALESMYSGLQDD